MKLRCQWMQHSQGWGWSLLHVSSLPVLSAPLIMGSFRASGSSPCTCPSNCSSVSKTGTQLMSYIQSDRSETANGRSLHLITLWHRREPVPLTPVRCSYLVTTRWFCSFLFPASIRTQTLIVQPSRWEKEISRWLRFNNQAFDTHKRCPQSQVTHEDVGVWLSSAIVWMAKFMPSHNWTASEQVSG